MADFLDILVKNAKENVKNGYYEGLSKITKINVSLRRAILEEKRAAVIAEIKAASPSAGIIKERIKPQEIAESMEKGGAIAISVLTEPNYFKGSLASLVATRESVKIPILMKDIILNPIQLEAAMKGGADVVLLIKAIFDRGYCDSKLDDMISLAHSKGLEVLLESRNKKEFNAALDTSADLVGINNRDLGSLKVNLNVTKKILQGINKKGKLVVGESGINTAADLNFLHKYGADAFLIGSAIMKSANIEEKVKEFVLAI
ncbi:MAG: indole-3-glycerol-phosphate synthase [Candidatus Bathyarchaeota archaeon]|nr:indole-3-glycerol-phosphate synthase [Candidatus Bathyarchaeota archaeon]